MTLKNNDQSNRQDVPFGYRDVIYKIEWTDTSRKSLYRLRVERSIL